MRSPCTTIREKPTQQWRSSTAKNKIFLSFKCSGVSNLTSGPRGAGGHLWLYWWCSPCGCTVHLDLTVRVHTCPAAKGQSLHIFAWSRTHWWWPGPTLSVHVAIRSTGELIHPWGEGWLEGCINTPVPPLPQGRTRKHTCSHKLGSTHFLLRGINEWVLVAQLCKTLCNLRDCSPPGSSVHGILQARILEWVATPFSRGSSRCRDQIPSPALQADSLPSESPGKSLIQRLDSNKHVRFCGSYSLSQLLHSATVVPRSRGQYVSELE